MSIATIALLFVGAAFGAGIASLYVRIKTGLYPWDLG